MVECTADQVETVAAWLRQVRVEGMGPLIAPVSVVAMSLGRSWAG